MSEPEVCKYFMDLWPEKTIVWATDLLPPESAEEVLDRVHPGYALVLAIKNKGSSLPIFNVNLGVDGDRYKARLTSVVKLFERPDRWQGEEDFNAYAFKAVCRPGCETSSTTRRRTLTLKMILEEPSEELVMAMFEAAHNMLVHKRGKEREKERLDSIKDIPLSGYGEETW